MKTVARAEQTATTNELIVISSNEIAGEMVSTVDARDLHKTHKKSLQ